MARKLITGYMGASLNQDERLTKELIPDFPVGCRRITPSLGYLKALSQQNVQVITDGIKEVCSEGLVLDNGEVIEVDVIVCATGFDLSFVPRFPILGENGNLQDIWTENLPSAYMSCMVPGMPNYFSQSPPKNVATSSTNSTQPSSGPTPQSATAAS